MFLMVLCLCNLLKLKVMMRGFICSMDIDLSKELMQPSKATLNRQVAAARQASSLDLAAKVQIFLFLPFMD